MLTSCAGEGASEKCSLNVIALRELRLGNDMVACFFVFFGEEVMHRVTACLFPVNFWLLSV